MNKKIMIADDNVNLTELLKEVLNREEGLEVVAVANNGKVCMEMLPIHKPDILLLDFIMPYMDGIAVLNEIKQLGLEKTPKIIMMTTFGQNDVAQKALLEGVSYFILKPFDVAHILRTVKDLVNESDDSRPHLYLGGRSLSLEEDVSEVLRHIGIPANIKGYMYLREAILMVTEKVELSGTMTKMVYPQIALKYNTTASRVERAIRHSIEVAWTRGPSADIDTILSGALRDFKYRPTNSELICLVADNMKRNQKIIS